MNARPLVDCINQFALANSNPLLSILPENGIVKIKQKYPEPVLSFSGIGLRAYYHCHSSESRPGAEHGHFHIFLESGSNQWAHLAGLSMDNVGQPLQWFTVNQWVTGESWMEAKQLEYHLNNVLVKTKPELDLVEHWILAMLGFYRQKLNDLLEKRDQNIKSLTKKQNPESILEDHSIYHLSQYKINLLRDLESYASLNVSPQLTI